MDRLNKAGEPAAGIAPVRICAVVVTFNPDIDRLREQLTLLAPQVDRIVLVDNGSAPAASCHFAALADGNIEQQLLGSNTGIAHAQNVGIAAARQDGATHVLLMDQDSLPAPDMVMQLLQALLDKNAAGIKVAAVGGCYSDGRQQNPPPFIRVRGFHLERCRCQTPAAVVAVDYLIASGTLIPMAVLAVAGGMREDFFIDYVDIEWGLRARRAGFQSFGVCAARMAHLLGEMPHEFMGRKIPMHSPLRHYYHVRNAVRLYCENNIPLNWKVVDGWRLLLKYVYYSLFGVPRRRHWWMMTLGLVHGLKNRLGPVEQAAGKKSP
jgi:rhamnosyltransferase